VSNPIEFLSTEEVWAYLLQNPNPWGRDNRPLYKLYACCRAEWHSAQAERRSALHASAGNGECPIQKEFFYALC
jgi:3'-phosphoadenosine 5'-phosphosulfate sulfotransferase (PAPS reductase)/FAD synthetase